MSNQKYSVPVGAIENGREQLRRVADHYSFVDIHGHSIKRCIDFIGAQACFEHLANYAGEATQEIDRLRSELVESQARELELRESLRYWLPAEKPLDGCFDDVSIKHRKEWEKAAQLRDEQEPPND